MAVKPRYPLFNINVHLKASADDKQATVAGSQCLNNVDYTLIQRLDVTTTSIQRIDVESTLFIKTLNQR